MKMEDNSIRVIHNYPSWLPLTQTWMFNQVKYLPASIESHIVCEVTENIEEFWLPNIHCLRDESRIAARWEKVIRNFNIPVANKYLTKIVNKIQAKIIHSHFGNNGWNNIKAAKKAKVKHVITFYGYDVNMLPTQDPSWYVRYHDLFLSADRFLCEGPYMRKSLIQMGCPSEKVFVHHLGVEVEKIQFIPRTWDKNDTLCVLIAASFVEKKGIPYALLALSEISKIVPMQITIIGDSNPKIHDNSEKQKILSIIKDKGLEKNTKLMGFQPYNVLFTEAYKNHIFISPSIVSSDGNTEGGAPVTLIEMQATGMPVVSTKHCDIPEVVNYNVDNWLVEEKDVDGLVSRLQWLIDNPLDWQRFETLGRDHVDKEFNAIKQGERLEIIYRNLI